MANHTSQRDASMQLCEYVLSTEFYNYRSWCIENELNPHEIKGFKQSRHVYALALIALGMEYLSDCEHRNIDKHSQCLDCNTDLTESIASQAHDKAKDRRKYGD